MREDPCPSLPNVTARKALTPPDSDEAKSLEVLTVVALVVAFISSVPPLSRALSRQLTVDRRVAAVATQNTGAFAALGPPYRVQSFVKLATSSFSELHIDLQGR